MTRVSVEGEAGRKSSRKANGIPPVPAAVRSTRREGRRARSPRAGSGPGGSDDSSCSRGGPAARRWCPGRTPPCARRERPIRHPGRPLRMLAAPITPGAPRRALPRRPCATANPWSASTCRRRLGTPSPPPPPGTSSGPPLWAWVIQRTTRLPRRRQSGNCESRAAGEQVARAAGGGPRPWADAAAGKLSSWDVGQPVPRAPPRWPARGMRARRSTARAAVAVAVPGPLLVGVRGRL
jgi:hypothetical protein